MNAEVVRYAGSDLVCYLATHPAELVKRQEDAWLPMLALIEKNIGVKLVPVRGIQYQQQSDDAISAMAEWVAGLNPENFTVLQAVTGVTGSVVIAACLAMGWVQADSAYKAAVIDEAYQLEKWGADSLAEKRLANIKFEIESAARFLDLIKASA
jgi:chaperone required for assembly of F1-ATPase